MQSVTIPAPAPAPGPIPHSNAAATTVLPAPTPARNASPPTNFGNIIVPTGYTRPLQVAPTNKGFFNSSYVRPFDEDALAWLGNVRANGGSVSDRTFAGVSAFTYSCKAAGLWSLIHRLNLYAGDQLAAAVVSVAFPDGGSALDTNNGFVESDYSESTGLSGDSSNTKYIDTGFVPTAVYPTVDNVHLAVYAREAASDQTVLIGSRTGGNNARRFDLAVGHTVLGTEFTAWQQSSRPSFSDTSGVGFYQGSRPDATNILLYRNGVLRSSTGASGAGTRSNFGVFVHGLSDGGVCVNSTGRRLADIRSARP